MIDKENVKSNPLAVVFIVVSAVVIYSASQFPDDGELGAGFFPIAISTGIIVFAVADLAITNETELEMSDYDLKPVVIVFSIILAYVASMPITGFLVGTMAFLLVIMYYSDVKSKMLIVTMTVLLPIALFYVFSQFFLIRLPEGVIPFSRLLPDLPLMVI